MSPHHKQTPDWIRLTRRERHVWAVAFALHVSYGADLALQVANVAVERLRSLSLSGEDEPLSLESEAARAGFSWEREEFGAWYRVADIMRRGHKVSYREPTAAEIDAAYERYQLGLSGFF
jgi:hypothetical protein